MSHDLRIIGHGLAGCVLGLTSYRRKISCKIFGTSLPGEASLASSGLIAPITGRRYVKAWKIDELISSALDFYRWTESLFGQTYFFPVEIVRFLSNPEAQKAWEKRINDPEYAAYISDRKYDFLDPFDKPYGILTGGFRLDTPGWLQAAHKFLKEQAILEISSEHFIPDEACKETIIFSTGAVDRSTAHGVIPNKGEALIVRMPNWDMPLIIKEEVFIVPLQEKDLYWVGSYYQPWPDHPGPTPEGREAIMLAISKVYKGSIELVSHVSGVRPTVDDRRPLIGAYPGRPGQFEFNGMGTKGTSLAPFWADQLLSHMTVNLPLPAEVSPARY